MAFYPTANKTIKGNSGGSYTGGPFKGLLHTTEGSSASGAISAFRTNNSWPHFLIDYAGAIWQFLDTAVSARALRNLSGGVQTNRDSVIQLEIVGFAGKPNEHPVAQMDAVRELMRWIEQIHGVKPKGPGRPFATAYGQHNLRFTNAEWDNFDGWCGHCHCVEQTHWDPGAINLDSLLPFVPRPLEEAPVAQIIKHPTIGYIVLQSKDGGIFSYGGAPFYGSVPSIIPGGVKVVGAAWTPSGFGYWVLGLDGGVFSFGDAVYKGGFNQLDTATKGNRVPIGIVANSGGYEIVTQDPSGDSSPFDSYRFGI